jgi:hypothetical protein
MSMTWQEAAEDEAYSKLYAEISKEAIAEFGGERLVSFYHKHPDKAEKPLNALIEARKLFAASHYSAAVIHAFIAIEVLIKEVFARGLIYGSIHNDALADEIVTLAFSSMRLEGYTRFASKVFLEIAGIDLTKHLRTGASTHIKKEIDDLQGKRNKIIHNGDTGDKDEAEKAIAVASELMETLFPALVGKLGFHIHDGFRLCTNWTCKLPKERREHLKKLGID